MLGKIRYLEGQCNYFEFGQAVKANYPYLGKTDIQTGPFTEMPKLKDTKLNIAPNNNVSIKKSNDRRFEISGLNICSRYNITEELKSSPTCVNWKIKSILLDFPLEDLTVNDFFCKFNRTHTNVSTSAESSSQFYYNLSFTNEIFKENCTKEITLPSKWVKNELRKYITAFVKLCVHGCQRCDTKRSFICYSQRLKTNKKEEISKILSPYLWNLLGAIFVKIFIALLWAKYWKKARRSKKKGVKNASSCPEKLLINSGLHESLNSKKVHQDNGIRNHHDKEGATFIKAHNAKYYVFRRTSLFQVVKKYLHTMNCEGIIVIGRLYLKLFYKQ